MANTTSFPGPTSELPLVMSPTGPIPTSPATIRSNLDEDISSTNPDYTSNLPGSLVEDVLSTDVAAVVQSDQYFIDLVNSITPYGANPFLLSLLGQIYGIQQGAATNTSVYVTFYAVNSSDGVTPIPGIVIGQGFIVSDGTYQYICPDGGITGSDGYTLPMYAVSTMPGSWGIPEGTVNNLISAPPNPNSLILTVTNYEVGTPAIFAESTTQFRSRVLTAGLAASTGMSRYLRTLLSNIPGVQSRLISIRQNLQLKGWDIIVGGGDPYQVAYAIWQALFDTSNITSDQLVISYVFNTNPCQITTATKHYLTTGMNETITGVQGLTNINGVTVPVTVINDYVITIPINTIGSNGYTGGGFIYPNPNSITATISDYPDLYNVTFVNPPQELVSVVVTWNTNSPFVVSGPAVAQLGNGAIVGYINSINAGTDPINVVNLQGIFIMSVSSILPAQYIDSLNIAISINGIAATPTFGTNIIPGDPYSYFYTDSSNVVIQQAL